MKREQQFKLISILIVLFLLTSFISFAGEDDLPSLYQIYEEYFSIGAAVSVASWSQNTLDSHRPLVDRSFNSLTAENAMKPDYLQPREGFFNFKEANQIFDYAERNGKMVRGHTLVWHAQTPDWFFKDKDGNRIDEKDVISEEDRQLVLERMEAHIERVVGEYKGRVYAWDVVNEAISDGGSVYRQDSPWYRIFGEEFIKYAFQKAHEVDPEARLFYNDYSATNPNKRDRIIVLLEYLLENDVPIHGIGLQGHWGVDGPSIEHIEQAIQMYSDLGLEIQITELDVGMDGYTTAEQGERFTKIFNLFKKYSDVITNVTLWGVADDATWRPDDNPLLFDKNHEAKPAFWATVNPGKPWFVNKAEYKGAVTFKDSSDRTLAKLSTGDYHIDELDFALDNVRELELERGHLIRFYELEEFQGNTWAFASTDDFDGSEILNKAKSFTIEHLDFKNVVLNKNVEANIAADRAERAIDGDGNSSWSPRETAPYWLSVDLEEPHLLNRWVVKLYGTGPLAGDNSEGAFNATDFKLQISNDGESWEDIDIIEGNTASYTDRDINSTIARYVRLFVTRPSSLDFNQNLVVYEFEVYGIDIE